jgi:hypothetical protein
MMGRVTMTSHNFLILQSVCSVIRPVRFRGRFGVKSEGVRQGIRISVDAGVIGKGEGEL